MSACAEENQSDKGIQKDFESPKTIWQRRTGDTSKHHMPTWRSMGQPTAKA